MVENTSKVIAGEPVQVARTMLVDESGVDIEQMQDIIKRQATMIDKLAQKVEARDAEDADVTRKLIVQKSKKWVVPFGADELIEFAKDELDDLHKFVCRVGRNDLREIDEAPNVTVYNAARKFPKMSRDDGVAYSANHHSFKIGKQ